MDTQNTAPNAPNCEKAPLERQSSELAGTFIKWCSDAARPGMRLAFYVGDGDTSYVDVCCDPPRIEVVIAEKDKSSPSVLAHEAAHVFCAGRFPGLCEVLYDGGHEDFLEALAMFLEGPILAEWGQPIKYRFTTNPAIEAWRMRLENEIPHGRGLEAVLKFLSALEIIRVTGEDDPAAVVRRAFENIQGEAS